MDIFKKNKKNINNSKKAKLFYLAESLKSAEITKNDGQKLLDILKENNYERLDIQLNELMQRFDTRIEEIFGEEQKISATIKKINKIIKSEKAVQINSYLDFLEQKILPKIENKLDILYVLDKTALITTTEVTGQKISELMDKIVAFEEEEQALRSDIFKYSEAVNITSSRYKLSPSWEGKKQPLIELGKKLQERRNEYLTKQDSLNKQAKKIYALYLSNHKEVCSCLVKTATELRQILEENKSNIQLLTNLKQQIEGGEKAR